MALSAVPPAPAPPPTGPPAGFIVDLDGFEGPIDLLLSLARDQKVDLAKISILALAEQYLAFVQQARDLQLEVAADYLVMAAWLAYLKSRLLLPPSPADDEPSGADLAEALAARLRQLDAIRRAGAALFTRPRLGQERFVRGQPEGIAIRRHSRFRLSLHDLLQAYVAQRLQSRQQRLILTPPVTFRVEDAIKRLTAMLGGPDWRNLLAFMPVVPGDDLLRRATIAAHLAAGLELTKDGVVEMRQASPFAPIMIRRKP
jgi:segregation and condensation protein A